MDLAADLAQAEEPLVLLSAVTLLEERLEGSAGGPLSATCMLASQPIFKCDPSLHNLSLWHKVLRLARLSSEGEGAPPAQGRDRTGAGDRRGDGYVDDLRLRVAQLARKQRNLSFASRLLKADQAEQAGGGGLGPSLEQTGLNSAALQAKLEGALLTLAKGHDSLALQRLWDVMDMMEEGSSGFVPVGSRALSTSAAPQLSLSAAKVLRKVSLLLQDSQLSCWVLADQGVRAVISRIRSYRCRKRVLLTAPIKGPY